MHSTTHQIVLPTPPAELAAPVVALRDVRKVHGQGDGSVVALDGITVGLPRGSFTAIMGPSGSGKSTFLNVAAGLDRPAWGSTSACANVPLSSPAASSSASRSPARS